jgi:2-amino-4-hydroxy-6-hydroxymethyldihydropteridine diphosphokinase
LKEQPKTSPEWAFISIGSNISPEKYLPLAISRLHQLGKLLKTSCVYQNPAVGRPEQEDFLNAAVLIDTALPPLEIRNHLRVIEKDLDRVRTDDKFAARTIDLDLCLLGNQILDLTEIALPDPDLMTRAHLAVPLAELAPDFHHPITGESLQQIADRLRSEAILTLREDITNQIQQAAQAPS